MDLKKFISQSLIEIMDGLKEAQDGLKGRSHGRVCPTFAQYFTDREHVIAKSTDGRAITLVEYDVAVEASSEVGGGGGIRVLGGVLNIKAEETEKDVSKMVSRIKFKVPIIYPDVAETVTNIKA